MTKGAGVQVMRRTKKFQWGYRITNEVTGLRVTVGPFTKWFRAEDRMIEACGLRKKLGMYNKFHFTPGFNGWPEDELPVADDK